MKKNLALAVLALFSLSMAVAAEQPFVSGHYSFSYPEGYADIESVGKAFNALWRSFNEVFRFDPDPETHRCRVVILEDKAAFDDYIVKRVGATRGQPVYLKYSKSELSELVLYPERSGSGYAAFSGPELNRQLFLQYLYSFVNEPPVWIRDGFQAYFEKASYDEKTDRVETGGYSPWLETAKNLDADPVKKIDVDGILSAVTGTWESARFYPQAWAFVDFLLNTERGEYQRFFHEACILLEGTGDFNAESQQSNTDAIRNRFFRFNTNERAMGDFSVWLGNQRTFAELLQAGVTQYNRSAWADARKSLEAACKIRSDDPIIVYYLGLVSYAEKKYGEAETWYRKALEYGGETSTINWALGLNAYADKRYQEARVYLETAKSLNGIRYGEKASQLINSMPK